MAPLPSLNHQPQMASAAQPLTFIQLHVPGLNRYSHRQVLRPYAQNVRQISRTQLPQNYFKTLPQAALITISPLTYIAITVTDWIR